MKRVDLIRHLERNGCELLREGNSHTVYVNRAAKRVFLGSPPQRSERLSFAQDLRRSSDFAANALIFDFERPRHAPSCGLPVATIPGVVCPPEATSNPTTIAYEIATN